MTIVVAWMSTRINGLAFAKEPMAEAAVWLNKGGEEDVKKAQAYVNRERQKLDGTTDHVVYQFPDETPDPLKQARETLAKFVEERSALSAEINDAGGWEEFHQKNGNGHMQGWHKQRRMELQKQFNQKYPAPPPPGVEAGANA